MRLIHKIINSIYRKRNPINWQSLRSIKPLHNDFGFGRGTPIDRYYIEKFLQQHAHYITGTVVEIADSTYTHKFKTGEVKSEILHVSKDFKNATIIGDLAEPGQLPQNVADCFICTQTLNFIYEIDKAVKGIKQMLKQNGIALVTVAGLCQISRYDYDRWGDYWRFTALSAQKMFAPHFGENNVNVMVYGNVLSATCLLQGVPIEDITIEELDYTDQNYQVLIGIVAKNN